jgi:hypothetical protein
MTFHVILSPAEAKALKKHAPRHTPYLTGAQHGCILFTPKSSINSIAKGKHNMAVQKKATRRINVTFPTDLLALLDSVVPPRERNRFIVEATERSLRRERLRNALEASAGAWSDEDHPDLMTAEDIERYIRHLRESWMPRTWDEIIEEAGQETTPGPEEAAQGG